MSDLQWLVTLTLDRVILHTVMHHSSTSTYKQNFIEIEVTFCGRADGRFRHMLLGRLGGVDLKIQLKVTYPRKERKTRKIQTKTHKQ